MDITPKRYEKNAKVHPLAQLYKIALSVKNFGWRMPIVVDKDHILIAGEGRWLAYEKYKDEMQLPEPRIEVAEDLSEEQARAYRLADNLTASTEYDMEMVQEESSKLGTEYQQMLLFEPQEETQKTEKQEEEFINEEGYLEYLNQSIRQIVLHFPQEKYNGIIAKAELALTKYNLPTNSELFEKLLEEDAKH